jgi:hypothetical protein
MTISITFWFKSSRSRQPDADLPELPVRDPQLLVALRRNIEKLIADSYGTRIYHELFSALDRGGMLPPPLHSPMAQAMSLLLNVLDPSDISSFVKDLASGRFNHLRTVPALQL